MPTIQGFDYSFDKPTTADLIAARAGFVVRYAGGDPTKTLGAAEFTGLCAAHIPLVLVHETTADWMLGGADAGKQHAEMAREDAEAAGVNSAVPILAAADFQMTPDQVPAVMACLDAFAGELGGARYSGLYGDELAVKDAADAGYFTMQTSAWSGGVWDPRAVIEQSGQATIGGVLVDVDTAHSFRFQQFTPPAPTWSGRLFSYDHDAPQLYGIDVQAWQRRMQQRGWNLKADGWYGPLSAAACEAFQTEFAHDPAPGLTVDGIVGPYTWAAAFTIPITR